MHDSSFFCLVFFFCCRLSGIDANTNVSQCDCDVLSEVTRFQWHCSGYWHCKKIKRYLSRLNVDLSTPLTTEADTVRSHSTSTARSIICHTKCSHKSENFIIICQLNGQWELYKCHSKTETSQRIERAGEGERGEEKKHNFFPYLETFPDYYPGIISNIFYSTTARRARSVHIAREFVQSAPTRRMATNWAGRT